MAPSTLIIFLLVASMYMIFQVSSANMVTSDCCLRTLDKKIPFNNVKCYKRQTTAHGCNIEAIVFVTRRDKHLCAPPKSQWVKSLMEEVDRKRPHYKKECGR